MELRDLYDENKNVTGLTFVKGEQVPKGYYYLIVAIYIQNSKGEFLIQKRVASKGGKWATTAGHPKAGENSLEGLFVEVEEEIGIDLRSDKPVLFETCTKNDQFFDIYYLKKDINLQDIKIQKEEVDDIKWATIDEIKKMKEQDEFHEGHYRMFEKCLSYLSGGK